MRLWSRQLHPRSVGIAGLAAVMVLYAASVSRVPAAEVPEPPLQVSGIYPHLAVFSEYGECGIGAVVPWADRLWWITYPPHMRQGSNDKLYSIDRSLARITHPESVGGTHAARMIHAASRQLLIGPYAIDAEGKVRALDVQAIPGRYTAFAEHLTDPANKVYLFDMEGPIWEIDVHSLAGRRLFYKPVAGWHGKGAYTGQGRFVIANNGESPGGGVDSKQFELPVEQWPREPEDAGTLAEFDGQQWSTILRRQFVEVSGPGGIHGAPSPTAPLWAVGWDRRSLLLLVRDNDRWTTYRLPKATHAMDPRHGYYTEWPRIRPIDEHQALMCMAGMFFEFPLTFASGQARGIRPLCSHLRYVPDFCTWDQQLVVAADDTSIMQNPMAGQSQSNLWFGSLDDLRRWGPGFAFGGPWLGDTVAADTPSDPYLFAGFRGRMLHLASKEAAVDVTIEIDRDGSGSWEDLQQIHIAGSGYAYHVFDDDLQGEWIRFRLSRAATVSAYLHYAGASGRQHPSADAELIAGLASTDQPGSTVRIRPAKHNRNLQVLVDEPSPPAEADGEATDGQRYYEVDERLQFAAIEDAEHAAEADELLQFKPQVSYDDASAILTDHQDRRYRLPRVAGTAPLGRDVREVQSERTLARVGNVWYEVPRGDFRRLRPVAADRLAIHDFCTWRGMLVLAAAKPTAAGNGRVFAADDGRVALWFGCVDDLWRFGKPVGQGGPWKATTVAAGEPSDPYLMTGFDQKSCQLSHNSDQPVTFDIQIDYSNRDFWKPYAQIAVPAGETVTVDFPAGYAAHWVRCVVDRDCAATAWFEYR